MPDQHRPAACVRDDELHRIASRLDELQDQMADLVSLMDALGAASDQIVEALRAMHEVQDGLDELQVRIQEIEDRVQAPPSLPDMGAIIRWWRSICFGPDQDD